MTAPERLLAALADGLRRRVAERRQAEARLADFVFREGPGGTDQGALMDADWRYFISRTLAAAGEPGTLDLLERLSSDEETLRSLAIDPDPVLHGGLATIERIGGLTAVGLARRDLETGRVGLTRLGSAVLALAQEWEQRAAEPAPAAEAAVADDDGSR